MARAPTGWRRSATQNTGRANNDRFAKIAPLAAARQGPYRRRPPHSETHHATRLTCHPAPRRAARHLGRRRSEEHTSELQSPCNLVCRLLLEKKKKKKPRN